MARNITLANLRTRIYRRANLESHTSFVPTAEADDVVNDALTEVWDLLVDASPPDYYASTTTVTTVAGTSAYALPSDFLKLRAVHVDEGSDEFRPITEINEAEEQVFRPPDGVYSVRLRYIPNFTTLSSNSSTFDGVNGWEELATLSGAVRLLTKEGTDPGLLQLLQAERGRQEERIRERAYRNAGEPPRVVRRAGRVLSPEWARTWRTSVHGYRLRGANIEIYRLASSYVV